MKNLTKFFVAVATLFVGVSCATDPIEDLGQQVVGKGQTVITVSTGDDVRTSLGDKINGSYQVLWSEGDQLALHYKNSKDEWAVASSEALAAECEGRRAAEFTWEGEFAAPWCLTYPSSSAGSISFSATQSYAEDTFAPKTLPMYGYSEEADYTSVKLQHLAGVLRIGIYAEEVTTVKKLYVENLDGSPIAGTFNCDFANGGALTPTERVFSTISYDASDVVLSQNEAEPTLFHIVVIPGKYETLRVTIVTDKGTMVAKVKAGENSAKGPIAAGQVREFKSVKFKTETANELEINDEATLEAFKAAVEGGNTQDIVARVTADFAVANWSEPIKGFAGVLDGGNHTISGLTAPLFDDLKGSVSNLNLNAAISVSNEESVGIVARSMSANAILCNCSTSGTLKFNGSAAVVKLGGLVATTEFGAQISECINNAAITLTGECSGYFGGIAGKTEAYIFNSENKGAITFDAKATTSQQLYVGGIVGENTNLYISACKNDAAITLNGTVNDSTTSKEFYVGGLLGRYGRDKGSASVAPRDSENTVNGDITIGGTITLRECTPAASKTGASATTTNYQNWGGIAGRANQNGPARCINRGDLVVKATFTNTKTYLSNNNKSNDSHLYISPWIGGIYGHGTVAIDAESANYGSVVWESDCNFNVVLGGMVGRTSTITQNPCKNYGTVKFDAETTGNVYLGGFCGISMQTHKNIENYGTIEFAENAKAAIVYIAGLAGSGNLLFYEGTTPLSSHFGITGGKNYGKVVVNGDTTGDACIAGICGYVGNTTFDGCQNLVNEVEGSGSILVGTTASIGKAALVGGIVGQQPSGAAAQITNCVNAGPIVFNGDAKTNILLGGVVGAAPYTKAKIEGCSNTGNLTVGGDASCAKAYMGGVVATPNTTSSVLNVADCTNGSADGVCGTITFNGTTTSNMYAGGVIGYASSTPAATKCTNYGTVLINATNGSTAYIGGVLGYGAGNGQAANLYNYGDITANCSKAVTCGGIGSLAGNNEITNSESICNLKSNDAALNLGMFNGYAATHKGRKVTNSKVGGTIQRVGDSNPVTITNDNFSGYLFSGNASYPTTEGTDYSNITVVTPSTEE